MINPLLLAVCVVVHLFFNFLIVLIDTFLQRALRVVFLVDHLIGRLFVSILIAIAVSFYTHDLTSQIVLVSPAAVGTPQMHDLIQVVPLLR